MKKLFTENLGLKISAVLISVFLWFFVTSRGQSEITLDIPLEFKNIPADIGLVNTSVKTVSVTVRGHERPMLLPLSFQKRPVLYQLRSAARSRRR